MQKYQRIIFAAFALVQTTFRQTRSVNAARIYTCTVQCEFFSAQPDRIIRVYYRSVPAIVSIQI